EPMQVVDGPAGALALDRLHQGGVGSEHVVALERRRLGRYLVWGAGDGTRGACPRPKRLPSETSRVTQRPREVDQDDIEHEHGQHAESGDDRALHRGIGYGVERGAEPDTTRTP